MNINIVSKFQNRIYTCLEDRVLLKKELLDIDFFENPQNHPKFKGLQQLEQLNLSPIGEGLIVIDFDTKWLGALQSFLRMGSFQEALLFRAFKSNASLMKDEEAVFVELFEKALSKKGIHEVVFTEFKKTDKQGTFITMSLEQAHLETFEKIISFLKNQWKQEKKGCPLQREIHYFPLNPQGWVFENFNVSQMPDYLKMGKTLIDKGLDITPFIQDWQTFADIETDYSGYFQDVQEPHLTTEIIQYSKNKLNQIIPQVKTVDVKSQKSLTKRL